MEEYRRLCELAVGECGVISALPQNGLRQRLLDLGFLEKAEIACVGRSPAGDPAAYLICGAVIALRRADAGGLTVKVRRER